MCHWKQWRWVCTKIKNLPASGVILETAIQHAVSSKSGWHINFVERAGLLNRPLRTRTVVAWGGGGEKPPAARSGHGVHTVGTSHLFIVTIFGETRAIVSSGEVRPATLA